MANPFDALKNLVSGQGQAPQGQGQVPPGQQAQHGQQVRQGLAGLFGNQDELLNMLAKMGPPPDVSSFNSRQQAKPGEQASVPPKLDPANPGQQPQQAEGPAPDQPGGLGASLTQLSPIKKKAMPILPGQAGQPQLGGGGLGAVLGGN